MLLDYLRILKFTNTTDTLEDLSYANQDDSLAPSVALKTDDYLLLGMQYPFNNFFLHMANPNGARDVVVNVTENVTYNPVGPVFAQQTITFSDIPTQGAFTVAQGSDETDDIPFDVSAAELQLALRAFTGYSDVTVSGDTDAGFVVTFVNVASSPALLEVDDEHNLAIIVPASLKLELWDGSNWKQAVDIQDGTKASGATFSKSGHVLFSVNKKETGWQKVVDPTENGPEELDETHVYDLYWMKVSVDGDIPEDVTLNELGFAFTTGDKMKTIKSDVDRFMASIQQGKTNWIKEIMMASKLMVTDYKKAFVVHGPQQLVRMDDVWVPCTYKTLWLIFSSLGPAYAEQATAFHHQFHKNFNTQGITVDQDLNGKVSDWEKDSRIFQGVR